MSSYRVPCEESSAFFQSPIGTIEVVVSKKGVKKIDLVSRRKARTRASTKNKTLKDALHQLEEYFKGRRTEFDFPKDLNGTEFQCKVWKATEKIRYGQSSSYKEIAKKIQKPKAIRAVGQALKRNPIMLGIPCHRVLSKGGKLNGFNAGVANKEWLLEFEGASFKTSAF